MSSIGGLMTGLIYDMEYILYSSIYLDCRLIYNEHIKNRQVLQDY